jgi:hypothetical protein
LLIAGCETRVGRPVGGEPTQRLTSWIDGLPDFDGLLVGVFCTYSLFPYTLADTAARTAGVLNRLERAFHQKGGKVVDTRSDPADGSKLPTVSSGLGGNSRGRPYVGEQCEIACSSLCAEPIEGPAGLDSGLVVAGQQLAEQRPQDHRRERAINLLAMLDCRHEHGRCGINIAL